MPDIVITPGSAVIAFSGRSGVTQLRSVSGVGLQFYNEVLSSAALTMYDQGTSLGLSAFVLAKKVHIITSNISASIYDDVFFGNCSGGNITVVLPAASAQAGKQFTIKKIDSSGNTISFQTQYSNTIDGVSAISITNQYSSYDVLSNGIQSWYIY